MSSRSTIPLASIAEHYPSFLLQESDDRLVLTGTSLPVPDQLRDLSRFTPEHRSALHRGILSDLERWDGPERAREEAALLAEEGTYAVVTGQQAGLLGGPLYTFYKAIGTIRTAELLAEKYPANRFVPVFWIEGEDHDVDEIRRITLLGRSGDPVRVEYDDGDDARRSISSRSISQEGMASLRSQIEEHLPPTDFTSSLNELIDNASRNGESLVDSFARFFYQVLGETPLVLVSASNRELKSLAVDVIQQELDDPSRLYEALKGETERLAAAGLPVPIAPKEGGLFLQVDGERRSLNPVVAEGAGVDGESGGADGREYVLRGGAGIERSQLQSIIDEEPERFSPNVALRPVVQDAILPTAIYLGGPSEVAYIRQLAEVYRQFGIERSAVAPRPFVTLIEPKVERNLEGKGISFEMLFRSDFDAPSLLVDQEKEEELIAKGEEGKRKIAEGFELIARLVDEIDRSLEKSVAAGEHKAEKELENLVGRLRSGLRKKNETEIRRIESAREMILPGGKLQERSLNVIYFINKYGLEGVRDALAAIEVEPGGMELIYL